MMHPPSFWKDSDEAESTAAAVAVWLTRELGGIDSWRSQAEPGGDTLIIIRGTGLPSDPRLTITEEAQQDLSKHDAVRALMQSDAIEHLRDNPGAMLTLDNLGNVTQETEQLTIKRQDGTSHVRTVPKGAVDQMTRDGKLKFIMKVSGRG